MTKKIRTKPSGYYLRLSAKNNCPLQKTKQLSKYKLQRFLWKFGLKERRNLFIRYYLVKEAEYQTRHFSSWLVSNILCLNSIIFLLYQIFQVQECKACGQETGIVFRH